MGPLLTSEIKLFVTIITANNAFSREVLSHEFLVFWVKFFLVPFHSRSIQLVLGGFSSFIVLLCMQLYPITSVLHLIDKKEMLQEFCHTGSYPHQQTQRNHYHSQQKQKHKIDGKIHFAAWTARYLLHCLILLKSIMPKGIFNNCIIKFKGLSKQ